MRGIVLAPRGSRRATLVERVIELPSLVGEFLRRSSVELGVVPISRRTTKVCGRHNGD